MPANTLKLTSGESSSPQPFLSFAPDVIERLKEAESRGEYTAERLKVQDPAKYAAIIELRGQDWSEKRIAELLKVHHRTVAAVSDHEPEAIDAFRQRLIKKLRRGADRLVDRIVEHPDTVPIQVAGLVAAQLLDKAELLDGRANVRVEHVQREDIYNDWDSFVEKQLQPADVIEIGPGIRLEAGENSPIAGGAPEPGSALRTSGLVRTDVGSEVPPGKPTGSNQLCDNSDPPTGAGSRPEQGEPGGGVPPAGEPICSTDKGSQKFSGNRTHSL